MTPVIVPGLAAKDQRRQRRIGIGAAPLKTMSYFSKRGEFLSLEGQCTSKKTGQSSKAKIRFQSFFMLMTIQPFSLASS